MAAKKDTKQKRKLGYPREELVRRGAANYSLFKPDDVFLTVCTQLHNVSRHDEAALLQVYSNATLAACWMLRDIEERKPLQRFARYRKRNSTGYQTDAIARDIDKAYRERICSKFALNTNSFTSLCLTISNNISGWLQRMTTAEKKGQLRRYHECFNFIVRFGRNEGRKLGSLGRRAIYGYAFLQPKQEQCEEALRYITALLEDLPEEASLREEAESFRMTFGFRKGDELGTMRPETLRRLKALVERDMERLELYDELRVVAQEFLRFTPPGFPSIKGDGVSPGRMKVLLDDFLEVLEEFAQLPSLEDDELTEIYLTEDERELFRELQRRVYAAINTPHFVPLRYDRPDAVTRSRGISLLYDPKKKRYVLLIHLLAPGSSYRQPLNVTGELNDVNNPSIRLTPTQRPSGAMLFELEFSSYQQTQLDRARAEADLWKDKGRYSGAVRAVTLRPQYSEDRKRWWFEADIQIGLRPNSTATPERVVGVHVDPRAGYVVSILDLGGTCIEKFVLTEELIARRLENQHPQKQAKIRPAQRTPKERAHRVADALTAICVEHQAILGFENLGFIKE